MVFHQAERLGAGVVLLRLLSPLRELGWTQYAWLPGVGGIETELRSETAGVWTAANPMAFSVGGWNSPPGPAARMRELPSYLKDFSAALRAAQPHVVHVNTLLSLPEATVAKRLGLPVVLHIHELPPPGRKRTLSLQWAMRVADVIVAVSDAVRAMFDEVAVDTPVVTIRNGVPIPETTADAGNGEVRTVGTLGLLSHRKGTDVFLDAAQLVRAEDRSLEFEHAGPRGLSGDDDFELEIDSKMQSLDDPGVRLLGEVDGQSVLRSWSVFALPSRQDPYPLATLEAMALGLPVVATRVGGIPEQIEHLRTGLLVEPDDPRELADAVLMLGRDGELRARLASAARSDAVARFSIDRQARQLNDVWVAAVARKFAPPAARPLQESIEAISG